jgi:hypothetical protein
MHLSGSSALGPDHPTAERKQGASNQDLFHFEVLSMTMQLQKTRRDRFYLFGAAAINGGMATWW